MKNSKAIEHALKQQIILPLFYNDDAQVCIDVTKALYDAGIRCIEFTNRGANALHNFKQLVQAKQLLFTDMLLSVGTIKNASDVNDYTKAGADFLISPCYSNAIMQACKAYNIFWIPGCMTPSEINEAEQNGCVIVKLFPGNVLGTGFMQAIKPVFKNLRFIVTGGVEATKQNIDTWLQAGAIGVGLGSKLISDVRMLEKNYDQIKQQTQTLLAQLHV
jgi:2-dehydro-3-deoxyphosphogluconate aldolase / (4S)-4-hydroxy-2-oxoglutarate aldolase